MLAALPRLASACLRGVLHLLAPNLCWGCGTNLDSFAHFCPSCRKNLSHDPHSSCPRCASSVGPHAVVEDGCPHCRKERLTFLAAMRLGIYTDPLAGVVRRLKQAGGEILAEVMGELWAEVQEERLRELAADVVTPVPLHWRRRWERGFNQSAALARGVAARLGVPCQPGWLRRVRHTEMQKLIKSPTHRYENVKGAFAAYPGLKLHGERVLLIDDVMTTGHTASEAARPLLQAGAGSAVVAVLAHVHQG